MNALRLGELAQLSVLVLTVVTTRLPEKLCQEKIQAQAVNARRATVKKITASVTVQGKNVLKSADVLNVIIWKELIILNLLRENI